MQELDPVIRRVTKAHPLLKGLAAGHIDLIARGACHLEVQPGQYLLKRDEPADSLFLLWSGEVDLGFQARGSGFLRIDTLTAWDVLGWSAIVKPYRWHFDARAATPAGVVELDARRLRAEAEADPMLRLELFDRLMPMVAERLRLTQEHLLLAENRLRDASPR